MLLELAVVGLIALLLAVWGAGVWKRDMQTAGVQAHHAWMDGIRTAVQRYLVRYADQLTTDPAPGALADAGYADWRKPALSELKASGLLAQGYAETGPMRTAAQIIVATLAGCQSACAPQALVHSVLVPYSEGISGSGQRLVAQWLMAAGGYGAQVSWAAPQHIRGPSFSWQNPPEADMSALPAGTVALLAAQSGGNDDYLRVRDPRNPDFQADMNVKGSISAGGSLASASFLSIGAKAQRASACHSEGLIAQEPGAGLLFCRMGYWRSAPGAGGGFSTNSQTGCKSAEGSSTANPVTKGCWCGAGYAALRISDSGTASAAESSGRTIGYLCVD